MRGWLTNLLLNDDAGLIRGDVYVVALSKGPFLFRSYSHCGLGHCQTDIAWIEVSRQTICDQLMRTA